MADRLGQSERPDPAAPIGFGSGIDDYLAGLYGYTRRSGQSDAIIPVPAALLQEARDSMPPGDARALLTRVLERAKIEGGDMGHNETSGYDSRPDTEHHIAEVRQLLGEVISDLYRRAESHDASKLEEPELSVFNEYTPKLRDSTYGSEEYKAFLNGMGEGLKHHYAHNDHHPEHHPSGILSMDLVQLIEMLADWKAATLRHADGDLRRSIVQNAKRFRYSEELEHILLNTAEAMGWVDY